MVAAVLILIVCIDTALTGWMFAMQREYRRALKEQDQQLEMMRCWLAENDDIEL